MARTCPRQITPEEAWQITCHEAGHSIVAARLGLPFQRVVRGDGEHGEVEVCWSPVDDGPTRDRDQDVLSRWQQFYAAGAATEILLFDSYRAFASRHDQACHDLIEKRRCPIRADAWEQDIRLAKQILDRDSVDTVARELARRGELSDKEVCELLKCPLSWE